MCRFLILFFALVTVSFQGVAENAFPLKQEYFTLLPEIPMMEGMTEKTDKGFVFDKAEGQVVESVGFLSGNSPQKVWDFYRESLEGLGWKSLRNKVFSRDGEELLLKIATEKNGVLLTVRLSSLSRDIRPSQ